MTQCLSLSRVTAFKLQRSHFKIRPREFTESPQFISQTKGSRPERSSLWCFLVNSQSRLWQKLHWENKAQICFYIKRKQWIRSNHRSQRLKNVRTIPFHGKVVLSAHRDHFGQVNLHTHPLCSAVFWLVERCMWYFLASDCWRRKGWERVRKACWVSCDQANLHTPCAK